MGKVFLAGAGPGDPELITLKTYKLIQEADVIIYDNLINDALLELAKEKCEMIYAGKIRGNHSKQQHEINELLYEKSLTCNCVLRLKGGDPFVFGRGGEEALHLALRGVPFEIVPGISSAIAVPAYAGIPITHRGKAVSFRVVTGHKAVENDFSQLDWPSFAMDETIVFLMGLQNLSIITQKLIAIGKDPNVPCAVIEAGTTNQQKVVVASLHDIAEKALHVNSPAVIVVGEVVNLRHQLAWFEENASV